MASQSVMDAAARESRANAREDMAVLTSGARQKVDGAMASMQALGQTLLHPLDKKKQEEARVASEEQKKAAQEKCDEIRTVAAQQAAAERVAARSMVAKGVAETGGERYPVVSLDHPQQTTSPQADNYQPNHPPIADEPFDNHSSTPIALNTLDEPERPHDESLTSGESDTQTGAPKPVGGLSRESRSSEGEANVDSKGVEDADFYPSPRIAQT